ncbi:MAG: glycosyltransferase family 4 protein [Planctomycetota bacterium]
MLNHECPPIGGGSGVAMKHLAEQLARMDHAVEILTVGIRREQCHDSGVEVVRFPIYLRQGNLAGLRSWLSFLVRAPGELRGAVRRFQPDVVNSHFVFPAGYVVSRHARGVPHVTSVVGADIHDPTRRVSADANWLVRAACGSAVRHARCVTSPSTDLTRRTRALFPSAEVRTIPWGVPMFSVPPRSRERLGLRKDAIVICSLGRLVPRKRFHDLLRAAGRMQNDRVQVVLMGSGPAEGELRSLAESLGIMSRVVFTGRVSDEDKAAYLQAADMFCLTSEHEGFGLVYLEAMGLGCPAIASNVGGQNHIIRDGVDGYLVEVGNIEQLAERLNRLVGDERLLRRMAQAARGRAAEFSPEATAAKFISVFAEA